MKRSEGRIFTTHTGSLPRPEVLVELLAKVARGEEVDGSALERLVDESTLEVIRRQAQAGVDVINSGEQSRVSFSTYVTQRMSGFGGSWTRRGHKDQNEFPNIARPRAVQLMRDVPQCIGPLEYQRPDLAEQEVDGLLNGASKADTSHQDLFMSAASPGIIALTMGNAHYDSHEEYVMTLAEEMRQEYEIITNRGVVLQLDCPDLAMERHVAYQDDRIEVFQQVVALHIRAINHAIRNIPRAQVRLHVCWGNTEGPHHYDVPLEDILPIVYEANVGALVMEMANPRHAHEYKVYQRFPLPEHMLLVAGVIDTKTNYVEHPEVVADRLRLAVDAVGGDPTRVMAGTDCGFDTSAGSNRVDKDIVWLKLAAMRDGANLASQYYNW
ncbi:Methionine synthase, vitamin-B12 independent [hydrothermal vent metagenome]|uniref:Methionine synthase, vitamin-B12 independent n=1 Tax=hydrothermal vent metagenome TaxID=652676 RepID=A0A160VCE8_9ZZZZ|tara:strand:+ start:2068 stop:3216 length:1149 start_codon:yes stop_codon:yes gene_type:complete